MDSISLTKFPRFLYRYYGNPKYLLDVLSEKRLYHCATSDFNDPFDCNPLMAIGPCDSDELGRRFLKCYARMAQKRARMVNMRPISDAEVAKQSDEAFDLGLHRNMAWVNDYVVKELKKLGSLVRVCCFAKSPRNMMMWAHYARNHCGIALMFRSSFLCDVNGQFRGLNVEYNSRPIEMRHLVEAWETYLEKEDVLPMLGMIYARKTNEWMMENEVRFYSMQHKTHLSIDERAIVGVIFGANCSACLQKKVAQRLKEWRAKPRLFMASVDKSIHKLWIARWSQA